MTHITRQQWHNFHRRKGSWVDWAAVNDYFILQPPSSFAFKFDRWCDLFMRYYNRCFPDVYMDIRIGENHYYYTVTLDDLVRIWHKTNKLPSQAARDYYAAVTQAEETDAREAARIAREWRNYATTGDPDVSPEDYYRADAIWEDI